jgi:hypothetical protein
VITGFGQNGPPRRIVVTFAARGVTWSLDAQPPSFSLMARMRDV